MPTATSASFVEQPFTDFKLYRQRNANNDYEYSLHTTMVLPNTSYSAGQVFMQESDELNTCGLVFIVNKSNSVPNLALETTLHHTEHIGTLPFGNKEGRLKIYMMEIGGAPEGTSMLPRKKPKGHVDTDSAE